MAQVQCSKGHIYNSDEYASCPYCDHPGSFMNLEGQRDLGGNRTAAPDGFGRSQPAADRITPFSTAGDAPGRTVAPGGYAALNRSDSNVTVGYFKKREKYDPITGWLVCVGGENKGADYHIWARINTIGRGEDNDVCIKGDTSISREKHAKLAYDPRHNVYTLIPGENINNIYLNDEPVYTSVQVSAYDKIDMGESQFIFVPLCGERFRWEEEQ